MFNALNRYLSRLDGDPRQQQQKEGHGYGFQVLRNTNLELGVEPWFDFVVGINGRMIVRDQTPHLSSSFFVHREGLGPRNVSNERPGRLG